MLLVWLYFLFCNQTRENKGEKQPSCLNPPEVLLSFLVFARTHIRIPNTALAVVYSTTHQVMGEKPLTVTDAQSVIKQENIIRRAAR